MVVSSMHFGKTWHWFKVMFISLFIFPTVPPPTWSSHNLLDDASANPRCSAMFISSFLDWIFFPYISFIFGLLIAAYTRCALQKLCVLFTECMCVFFIILRTKSDFFPPQMIGIYDHAGVCLLCGILLLKSQFPRIRNIIVLYIWNVLYYNVHITICSNKNMKVMFFWDVMSCDLVDRYWHFEENYCLNLTLCPEDEGNRLLPKHRYVSIKLLCHTPEDHNLHLLSSGCPWINLHTG